MRKLATALLLVTFCLTAYAQQKKIDSLLAKIDKTSDPEEVRPIVSELVATPQGSAALLKKGRQYLETSVASENTKAREYALLMISAANFNLHDTPELLEASLQGVHISRNAKDYQYLAYFLHMAGLAYTYQQDNRRSASYYLAAAREALAVHDTIELMTDYSNLETTYVTLKMPDSAFFFARLELQIVRNFDPIRHYVEWQFALGDYGEVLSSVNKPDSALLYYRRAYLISKRHKFTTARPFLENNISKTYLKIGKLDSAAKYALEAYHELVNTNMWEFTADAAGTLATIYEDKDDKKSLFYLKVQLTARDSSNAVEKAKQFQLIAEKDQQQAQELKDAQEKYNARVRLYVVIGAATVLFAIGIILWRNNQRQKQTNLLLNEQKEEIEAQRDNLGQALEDLKNTQTQLVQREKMASLGELTAGIAHEIQNPLNFVNNFSEVNQEMLEELKAESEKPKAERDEQLETELINDLIDNERKINHHGKRADSIVKGMLEHSRSASGQKEPTDINQLADEYLRLSYHGLRAKDKNFNAELVTHFDTGLPKVNATAQDIGRVLLNLFNNAFYAVNQKSKTAGANCKPEVSVSTSAANGQVVINIKDNGTGIPDAIKEKIMQPFFTTKPTGEGTGLGLSLTYDMVVKGHGGSIQVNSVDGEGSEFIIQLPIT
jgi:two-component system, NtrC family, sensor kinase